MVITQIKIWLTLTLVTATAVIIWMMMRPPDEQTLIVRQLKKLSSSASKYGGEGTTHALVKSKALEKVFAPSCTVDINIDFINGTFTPEEISGKAVFFRRFFNTAVITFYDINVELAGTEHAVTTMTASLDGELKSNKRVSEFRNLRCGLKKSNGTWLIHIIEIQPILEK
jgi:hypothetical protein